MRDLRSDKLITDLNADNHAIKGLSSLTFNADGIFRPGADSTTAFQLQNASGALTILNIDSLSGNVGIGTTAPVVDLQASKGAFGDSVTVDRAPRPLNLISTNATMRVWRFRGDVGWDPAVELIWGNQPNPGDSGNYFWDFFVDSYNGNFNIRDRSYGQGDARRLVINSSGEVLPNTAGTQNLGNATYYWNDVSYKTLTDRGCLGAFDAGVELRDGSIVSDIEALEAIQVHPTKQTIYGVPRLDYRTMPKAVFKPAADDKGNLFERDKNDEPKPFIEQVRHEVNGKLVIEEVLRQPEDGAEMTALISIMLGAIKELSARLKRLEAARI